MGKRQELRPPQEYIPQQHYIPPLYDGQVMAQQQHVGLRYGSLSLRLAKWKELRQKDRAWMRNRIARDKDELSSRRLGLAESLRDGIKLSRMVVISDFQPVPLKPEDRPTGDTITSILEEIDMASNSADNNRVNV